MEGSSLQKTRAQWEAALDGAVDAFRNLIAESSSKAWKPVPTTASTSSSTNIGPPSSASASTSRSAGPSSPARTSTSKGKAQDPSSLRHVKSIGDVAQDRHDQGASATSAAAHTSVDGAARSGILFKLGNLRSDSVVVHRRSAKGPDVYRAVAELPFQGDADLAAFRCVLQTAESRPYWDRLVQSAELVEQPAPTTRISKVNYRLGWPASPRDAIIISRTMADESTLIDVSTSLPRSPDAPAYLRPAPPCVRSHVHLMAWCIQILPSDPSNASSKQPISLANNTPSARVKITFFWSWDLKGAWMGMPTGGLGMHLPELLKGLVNQVREASPKMPMVQNYGSCVELLSSSFDPTRDTLLTEYAIVVEDEAAKEAEDHSKKDLDTVNLIRSRRKLEAAIEFSLLDVEGWDVQITCRSQTKSDAADTWRPVAEQAVDSHRIILTIRHPQLNQAEEIVKIKVRIQRVVASSGLRLNDAPFDVSRIEPRTPASLSQALLEDTASISGVSLATNSTGSASSVAVGLTVNASRSGTPNLGHTHQINSQIRRNYIYFTSLLQEPEAKWKPITDMKGVTVTQLDSIDPTLVVYRAEATFVGVSVWDLFSTISNPGARAFWDKTLDDAVLLTDVNDLSSLWHLKTRPSWPVSARDTVVIQTAYKAPTSVHIFSFSTDDRAQFPQIPAIDVGTIRTQVDLRGWSVEALSPTTVHITMLEQSDPKGWTSKSATPSAMVGAVAGVGEYAIKFGGPPVLTRLLGARTKVSKYDHDKATFRLEYASSETSEDLSEAPNVECEIRCDVETWSTSLDLVVDPPPISVSCLRRHKLSQGGGGLWLTIEHVAASLEDDVARITIRKGTSREKGAVLVNGATIKVDVDDLKDDQVQQLTKQKRTKPQRIPLDLTNPLPKPEAVSGNLPDSSASPSLGSQASEHPTGSGGEAAQLRDKAINSAPRSRESTKDGERTPGTSTVTNAFFSDERPRQPMTCALDVLFLLRRIHAERSPDPAGSPAGWALVSERNGLYVRRKLMESISNTVLVQRGDKVVQGLSAEDLLDVISSLHCRKQWDDKVDSTTLLESYGNGATTSFITTKASFPFRGRGFYLASLTARATPPSASSATNPGESILSSSASSWSGPAIYFHASASFPQQNSRFPLTNLNSQNLPLGKVLIDGWILETLDPYSSTSFQIPSTRCTHVVAVDYAGSLPIAVNSMWNANLPRSVQLIEDYLKARGSIPSVKTPPACMQVLGDGRDEDQGLVWTMNDPERKNLFLSSTFDPASRAFTALCMHRPSSKLSDSSMLAPALQLRGDSEPMSNTRPSSLSDASTTKASADKAVSTIRAAPGTPSTGSAAPPVGSTGDQGTSLSRATSLHSIASSIGTGTSSTLRQRPSSIRSDSRRATDLILMEIEIELRHYPKGYDVQVFSELIRDRHAPAKPAHSFNTADEKTKEESSAMETSLSDAVSKQNGNGIEATAKIDGSPQKKSDEDGNGLALKMASQGTHDLPVQIKVYDLPPSAVLAATLDPSARPRKHLLRITLPTTTFLDPIEDPLTGSKAPEIPEWYNGLLDRGAVLRTVIKPLNADGGLAEPIGSINSAKEGGSATFTTPTGKVPVTSGANKLEIVHVNQTSAMLQKEQVGIEPMTQVKRAAPQKPKATNRSTGDESATREAEDDRLPTMLRLPIAVDKDLMKVQEAVSKLDPSSAAKALNGKANANANASSTKPKDTPSTSALPSGTQTPVNGSVPAGGGGINASAAGSSSASGSGAATPSGPTSAGAHIMNMFGAYPLSRLGTGSALASVSSVTARGSSVASTSSAKTNAEALAANDRAKQSAKNGSSDKGAVGKDFTLDDPTKTKKEDGTMENAASVAASAASNAVDAAANAGTTVLEAIKSAFKYASEAQFRFSTLVLVAIVFFLLGSLMRSMVTPVDFVLLPTKQAAFHSNSIATTGPSSDRKASKRTGLLGSKTVSSSSKQTMEDYLGLIKQVGGKDGAISSKTLDFLQEIGSGDGNDRPNTGGLVQQVQWTELKRMLQIRAPGFGWDLVLGGIRRR